VELRGSYAYEELQQRLSGLDALVMGSSWYENSPMVIQEAFQHGLPLLAPRLGGMAEKVRDGVTGWLFEPGDVQDLVRVIAQITAQPDQLRTRGQRARREATRLGRTALQHERLYRRLLQGS
jgi:glycosyltransferase involved in cell wall biosynthesis